MRHTSILSQRNFHCEPATRVGNTKARTQGWLVILDQS
jgi:hypothetical protein